MGKINKQISLATIFFFLSSAALASEASENPWRLKRDREGIKIYTRRVAGSPIQEFRAEMIVNSPPEQVLGLFEQEKRIHEWFHRCGQAELVEKISPDEKRVYFVADLIWPFRDRDGVYRSMKSTDSASGAVTYKIFPDNRDYPKRKRRVRIHHLKTEWRFTPLDGGRTRVEYQQHSEAGGFIPSVLVNLFVVSIPFKTFKKFRALL